MGEGGQIWLKCITGDLIMMIRDKNNIFEGVENFHADLAWNYPIIPLPFVETWNGTSWVMLNENMWMDEGRYLHAAVSIKAGTLACI